jgi:hypothetical protein
LQGAEEGNTVEMFSSLYGFFFHIRDEQVPDSVKSWNVKRLTLDRNARHNDVQIAPHLHYPLFPKTISTTAESEPGVMEYDMDPSLEWQAAAQFVLESQQLAEQQAA